MQVNITTQYCTSLDIKPSENLFSAEVNCYDLLQNHVIVCAEKSPFGVYGEVLSVSNGNSLDQTVPNLSSPSQLSPSSHAAQALFDEHFSRKVFVGGLPPDIDEGTFVSIELFLYNVTWCCI